MRVYRVGVVGHHPERFRNIEEVKQLCLDVVGIMQYQYDDQDGLRFVLGGEIGAEQWFGQACIQRDAEFDLVLPFPAELLSQYWFDEQQQVLDEQLNYCSGLTVLKPDCDSGLDRDLQYEQKFQIIVDSSDFVICFWEGRKFGQTFDAIEYALQNSKIVLNALTGLSLVTKEQIED